MTCTHYWGRLWKLRSSDLWSVTWLLLRCACRYGVLFSLLKLTGYYFGIVVCQMDYIFIDGVAILSLSMTFLQHVIIPVLKCICKMKCKGVVCSLVDLRHFSWHRSSTPCSASTTGKCAEFHRCHAGYCITLSQPAKVLGQDRPTSSLLGPLNLASFFGSYIITLCFLIGAIFLMYSDPDYVRWPAK